MTDKQIKKLLDKLENLAPSSVSRVEANNSFIQERVILCVKDSFKEYASKSSMHPNRSWKVDGYVVLNGNNINFTTDITKATNFLLKSWNPKILEVVCLEDYTFQQYNILIQQYKTTMTKFSFEKDKCGDTCVW